MRDDIGIETLLNLNDYIISQEGGYWVKIEAWTVPVTISIPHGICYSITLHEPYGKRILAYDNSDAIKAPKKYKFAGHRQAYDHKHRHVADKGVPYEFKDVYQLLADSFGEVDILLSVLLK